MRGNNNGKMVWHSEVYGGYGSHSAIGSFSFDAKKAREWREEKRELEKQMREKERIELAKKDENNGKVAREKPLMNGGLENFGT